MTADLNGIVKISSEPMDLSWARNLHSKSQPVAALPENSRSLTLLDRARRSITSFAKQVIRADGTAEVVASEPAVPAAAPVVAPEAKVIAGSRQELFSSSAWAHRSESYPVDLYRWQKAGLRGDPVVCPSLG